MGLFDDIPLVNAPAGRTGLFDDIPLAKTPQEPDAEVAAYDDSTTVGERVRNDWQRSWKTALQGLRTALMREPDPFNRQISPADEALGLVEPYGLPENTEDQAHAELASSIVQHGKEIAAIPRRPVLDQLSALPAGSPVGEHLKVLARDPLGAVAGLTVESAAPVIPGLLAGMVNPAAGAAVLGATSGLQESNSEVLNFLQNRGVDFTSPEAIKAAFADPALMREANRRGLTAGAIVGTLDALTGGLASKTLVPKALVGSVVGRELANIPAQAVAQAAGGGGGEALKQLALEGRITNPGDITAEIVGSAATAPAEVAAFGSHRLSALVRERQKSDPAPAPTPAPAPAPAPKPAPAPAPKPKAAGTPEQMPFDFGSAVPVEPSTSLDARFFHGSPHDFTAFDSEKIGSGEGAQAFGHGLYFAENQDVAGSYKLAAGATGTRGTGNVQNEAIEAVQAVPVEQRANALAYLDQNDPDWPVTGSLRKAIEHIQSSQDLLKSIEALDGMEIGTEEQGRLHNEIYDAIPVTGGNVYTVDIPDQVTRQFLQWDKPLAKQPAGVKEALRSSGLWSEHRAHRSDFSAHGTTRVDKGSGLYAYLEAKLGSAKAASEALQSLGITGIRYLDAGSRAAGRGTYNAVLFDPKNATITRRNGASMQTPGLDTQTTEQRAPDDRESYQEGAASQDAGETGLEQQNSAEPHSGETLEARKGPLNAHADGPARRSLYSRVFSDAGVDPKAAEFLPAKQQFGIIAGQLEKRYGFNGVKKGVTHNWREALDAGMDAYQNLDSMAAATGLPVNAMSLDGRVKLSFTAGGKGALASYSWGGGTPGGEVKVSRRNSAFAHEWMHALDHYLLDKSGASNTHLIKGQLITGKLRRGLDTSNQPPTLTEALGQVLHVMYRDDAAKAALIRTLELRLEKATDQKEIATIKKQLKAARKNLPPESSFYTSATSLDKGKYQTPESGPSKGYWQKPTEMWARAGEAWIARNIERFSGAGTSFISLADRQYLDAADAFIKKAYPQAGDRERIFEALDDLFTVIQNLQLFGSEKPPQPRTDNPTFDALDIRLWKNVKAPDQYKGMTTYRRVVTALSNTIKDEIPAMRRWWEAEGKRRQNDKNAKYDVPMHQHVSRILAGLSLRSPTGVFIYLERTYPKSAAVRELTRSLVHLPGFGREAGRSYHDKIKLYAGENLAKLNQLAKKFNLDTRTPETSDALRLIMLGQRGDGRTLLQDAGIALKKLMQQVWYDQNAAGIDIGYTDENYLNRVYDDVAIADNPQKFVEQATKAYEAGGEKHADARRMAEDWLYRRRAHGIDLHTESAASSITATRALPAEADVLLGDFMIRDPLVLARTYIMQASRRLAWADTFGPKSKRYKSIFRQMHDEGVDGPDIEIAHKAVDVLTGRKRTDLPRPAQHVMSFIHAIGTITLLPRAPMSSLVESATVGITTGSALDGLRSLGKTVAAAVGTEDARDMRETLEAIGVIEDSLTDVMLADQIGGSFDDPRWATALLASFFHKTGLSSLTRAQEVSAGILGDAFLRGLARRYLDHVGTSPGLQLVELGAPAAQVKAFSEWLLGLGRRPTVQDLENAPKDFRYYYATAINRVIHLSIQSSSAATRVMAANGPFGRIIFGVMGFLWSFQRNVTLASLHKLTAGVTGVYGGQHLTVKQRLAGEADGETLTGKQRLSGRLGGVELTPQERMGQFTGGLLMAWGTLFVLQFMLSVLRDVLTNKDAFDEQGDDFWERAVSDTSVKRSVTRMGLPGAWDPFIQAATGLRYQRDLSNLFVGAGPGYALQAAQRIGQATVRNSPETNTTEFSQLVGLYQLAAAPTINFALTRAGGGPLAQAAEGAVMMMLSSPQAGAEAAELIVGPKGSKTPDEAKRAEREKRRYEQSPEGRRERRQQRLQKERQHSR